MWLPFVLTTSAPGPVVGSHTFRLTNERIWPQLFLVGNLFLVFLFLLLVVMRPMELIRSGFGTAEVLVPVCVFAVSNVLIFVLWLVVGRQRLTLDFDRGVLVRGRAEYPAAEITALISQASSFLGNEHSLRFVFPSGEILVPTGGLAPSPEILRRNALLGAFIQQCVPIPEHAAEDRGSSARTSRYAIGTAEALRQLSR